MRIITAVSVGCLAFGLIGCGNHEKRQQEEMARKAMEDSIARKAGRAAYQASREAGKLAEKAGREIKKDAKEMQKGWKDAERESKAKGR
ncbi:MAG: hypothetical protein JSU00_12145 [Acidobacteria bacterium]|nr:hypothetical protein [Acidobacteriota bacterium]